ncbi:hypothetical protein NQ166_12565 [Microbacterium sp. zg.Y1090]|nr:MULTISPECIES: hypothetical protein [unclassified Microbacterium]MCR2813828.1 hypothetical protein [Microbacterium sp. zg.Y1084]MCR2819658.1 hypothetical protein [Microbacterium sp. zg.Y1090]MDL5487506.1 hypothetical protein [Microbacterium sp. zg-Y1211]WIM28097.1 hypothetical protein QNO26_13265 [Microbacterium sp. zg-Y1090]
MRYPSDEPNQAETDAAEAIFARLPEFDVVEGELMPRSARPGGGRAQRR